MRRTRYPTFFLLILLAVPARARVLADADLAPIPLGPHDREVRARMARGEWAEAAKRLTATAPGPRLVRGWLLWRSGDAAGALAALAGVPEKLPALADLAHDLRAEALLALKRPADAAREAAAVASKSAWAADALRVRARALREAGRHDEARKAYQAIVDSRDPDEVPVGLLGLARLETETGHPERAVPLLRRVDVESPTHWAADEARSEAAALVKAHPELQKAWADRSPAQVVDRAERLLDAHRNEEAADSLAALPDGALDDAARCRARYFQGRALRGLRRWEEARPLIDGAVAVCAKIHSDLLPPALYLAASAAERLGADDVAVDQYRHLLEDHPKHRLADDAGYFLVRHLIDDDKKADDARDLAKRLVAEHADGDMTGDAVFYVALDAMLRGDRARAREVLALADELPPPEPADRDAGRTAYWRARLDLDDGRTDAAKAGLESVLATYPFSWYAVMAYDRLREIDVAGARKAAAKALTTVEPHPTLPGADALDWKLPVPAGLPGPALDRALLLVRLGLLEPARDELKAAGLESTKDEEVLWFTAWLLDRTGVYAYSHDILRRRLPVFRRFAPAGPLRKHWLLAFPRPFAPFVEAASKATGVDPWFLWAIMREESGFNTGAESFTNAQGLMQLMLPTAKRMATKDDGAIDRAALSDPGLNLRLAARYMKFIRDSLEVPYELVPAAYNAGENALARWLRDRAGLPLDLFVEAIPYEETRWYTQRVVATWATYRYLYGKPGADPLPCLSQKIP